jgi:hypothetical protein
MLLHQKLFGSESVRASCASLNGRDISYGFCEGHCNRRASSDDSKVELSGSGGETVRLREPSAVRNAGQ